LSAFFLLLLALIVFAAMFAGMPVYLALGGGALLAAFVGLVFGAFDPSLLIAVPIRVIGIAQNETLAAVPFFVLIGTLLDRSGIAGDMIGFLARSGSGRSLPLAVLAVAVLLAASTGVAGATIVMLAAVALPGMQKAGMARGRAGGLLAASGTLGQIIPPSILLVLLADQVSNAWIEAQRAKGIFAATPITVADLFAACLVPGLILAALYAVYIAVSYPAAPDQTGNRKRSVPSPTADSLFAVLAPILLILAVLGTILFGVATPVEASACGAFGALVLAAMRQAKAITGGLLDAVRLTGAIFAIVIGASMVSLVIRGFDGDTMIAGLLAGDSGQHALLAVMVAIFLLGFVIEFVEMVYIVIPLAAPPLFAAGVDPIWFAALVALNLQTSFLTPPFGLSLFYLRSAAPQLPYGELVAGVVPFILLQLIGLGLVAAVPALATGLPELLFSRPGY